MLTPYNYLHGKQIVDGYIEVVSYFLELISGGRRFFPFDNRAASKAELSLQFRKLRPFVFAKVLILSRNVSM